MTLTRTLLHALRRRFLLQEFLRRGAQLLLSLGGVALVIGIFAPIVRVEVWLAAVGGALLGGFLWAWITAPTLEQVAVQVDQRAKTQDRLTSALAFEGATAPMQRAALEECERFLSSTDLFSALPWRWPRTAPWLGVLMLLAAAVLFFTPPSPESDGPEKVADTRTKETAKHLEELAKKFETTDPVSKEIAEALKKGAERLHTEAKGENPEKAVLRELSALEELLKASGEGGRLKEMAQALEKSPALEKAGEAMKRNDLEAAAQRLRDAAQQLADSGEKSALMKQMEAALKEAAERMGGKDQPLQKATARAASAAQKGEAQQLSKELGQMAQALKESNSPSKEGREASDKEMKSLLGKLREMKAGEKQGESGKEGNGKGESLSPSEGEGGEPKTAMLGPGNSPSGQAGSERDEGSKPSPYGKTATPEAESDKKVQLEGLLGEGESLRSLIPSKPGEMPAKTGYKELFKAVTQSEADALEKENIPIGSRLYIKRYFESIRPKE